jgi:hypothetical protein
MVRKYRNFKLLMFAGSFCDAGGQFSVDGGEWQSKVGFAASAAGDWSTAMGRLPAGIQRRGTADRQIADALSTMPSWPSAANRLRGHAGVHPALG